MTFLEFATMYHATIVAFTVVIACLWLETFCALRRAYGPARRAGPRSFVKLSLYLSERLFIHVAYTV